MRKNLINAAIVSCLLAFAGTAAAAGQQGGQGGWQDEPTPAGWTLNQKQGLNEWKKSFTGSMFRSYVVKAGKKDNKTMADLIAKKAGCEVGEHVDEMGGIEIDCPGPGQNGAGMRMLMVYDQRYGPDWVWINEFICPSADIEQVCYADFGEIFEHSHNVAIK